MKCVITVFYVSLRLHGALVCHMTNKSKYQYPIEVVEEMLLTLGP